jgi:hypothetical protein
VKNERDDLSLNERASAIAAKLTALENAKALA